MTDAVSPDSLSTTHPTHGLYIHVPFCATRCGYCDFNTYTPQELGDQHGNSIPGYLNALEAELDRAAAMWDVLDTAGFEDGAVLEPGCGSGEFLGLAPEGARMVGVEVDQTTARIAAHLHPDQQIHAAGFEKTMLPEDSFHAVVGNVPFGEFSVGPHRG